MVARIAVSKTGRNGQYVGTIRRPAPTPGIGSPTARWFNGSSDRIIGRRSNDLGAYYVMTLTFWRAETQEVPHNVVAQRLFSQYSLGGTRVGVGLNRKSLGLTLTLHNGAPILLESPFTLQDTQRHHLTLQVLPNEVFVYLDGRQVFHVESALAAPDSALFNIGSDAGSRFFHGWIDDVAFNTDPPRDVANWFRYYIALTDNQDHRDMVYTTFGDHSTSVTLSEGDLAAAGGTNDSRAATAQAFRYEPELPEQNVEFRFTPIVGTSYVRVGVVNADHNLSGRDLGESSDSFGWMQDGRLRHGSSTLVSGIPTWQVTDIMTLRWEAATRDLTILKNGLPIHKHTLPEGVWFPAVTMGMNIVRLNSGQFRPAGIPPASLGLPETVRSLLTSEYRQMNLAPVAAPLDDEDLTVRDAYTGTGVGIYRTPAVTSAPFTGDSLDVAREVGGGIRINARPAAIAGEGFFFVIAYSPAESDMTGEKVIMESPGNWGLRMLDGNLNAWVGSVQIGTPSPPLQAGKSYILGVTRSPAGRLLVWTNIGYVLQSGDVTVPQTVERDVWVGSAAEGAKAVAGKFSHVALSPTTLDTWKLDRLRRVYAWDTPDIAGTIPNPATERKVFEPSWRDIIVMGISSSPIPTQCYPAAVGAAPDSLTVGFRMVTRVGSLNFSGDAIFEWTPHARLPALPISPTSTVTLRDMEDLDGVVPGVAAMVGDEIVRVDSINHVTGEVTLARGCIDTVPQAHPANSILWFYQGVTAYAPQAQLINTDVDIKLLSRNALTELEEGMAPTDTLKMIGRLARPYPPADVQINDMYAPESLHGTINLKWKHRNKASQGAGLTSWAEASVTPPTGLTYRVRAFDASTGETLHESSMLSRDTDEYNLYVDDFTGTLAVEVVSNESSMDCLQAPRFTFDYTSDSVGVMTLEGGDAIDIEHADQNVYLEPISKLKAGSHNGELPDDYVFDDDEEEEETEDGSTYVDGMPISAMTPITEDPLPSDVFPIVSGLENFKMSFSQLLTWLASRIELPKDGASAYEIAGGDDMWGDEATWLASLQGPRGLSSNASRRIQVITSASGAIVCDWEQFDEIRISLAGDVVLTFQGAQDGQGCMLKFKQDLTGFKRVSLPATVRFNNLVQSYSATPNPGLVDKIGFVYDSNESFYDLVSIVPGISDISD